MTLPAKTGVRIAVDFSPREPRRKTSAADSAPPLFGHRAALLGHLRDMADYGRTDNGDRYIRYHGDSWEPVTQTTVNALCGILTRSLMCPVRRDDVQAVVSLLCSSGREKPERQRQVIPRMERERPGAEQRDYFGEKFSKA